MQEDESGFTFIPIKPMKTITIPREQISSIVKPGNEEKILIMLCNFIRFCRGREREYRCGIGDVSGSVLFTHLLHNAGLEDALFVTLMDCIEDYTNPYKIVFGDVDSEVEINDN
jgi:hypothetical protein